MTRISLSAAFVVFLGAIGASSLATQAAAAPRCQYTLEQYSDYAKRLAPFAERARQQAEANPIYESDSAYYTAELADVRQCIKMLGPVETAERRSDSASGAATQLR
jgi:hypothetical protein